MGMAPIQLAIILSEMVQAMQVTLVVVGEPLLFDPLCLFMAYIGVEYGSFQHDQMQPFQDFWYEKETTPRMMCTRLVQSAIVSKGIFVESKLVKIFLSKIYKRLLDLTTLRIIINYKGQETLAQAFTKVQRCDRALCQHDAIDKVS